MKKNTILTKVEFTDILKEVDISDRLVEGMHINLEFIEFIEAIQSTIEDNEEIVFSDCEFLFKYTNHLDIRGLNKSLYFDKCSFIDDLKFEDINLRNRQDDLSIIFKECRFDKNVCFDKIYDLVTEENSVRIRFIDSVKLNKIFILNIDSKDKSFFISVENNNTVTINKLVFFNINNLKFNFKSVEIKELEINNFDRPKFDEIEDVLFGNINVIKSIFSDSIEMINSVNYSFREVSFTNKLKINDKIEIVKISFEDNCIFEKDVILNNCNIGDLIIKDCDFDDKLYIKDAAITKIDFSNCLFNDTVKIVNLKKIEQASFERSTIKRFFFFNGWCGTIFLDQECYIDFSHVFVESSGHIIIRNIGNMKQKDYKGGVNLNYANIIGTITIQDSIFETFNLDKSTIIGQINFENVDVKEYESRDTLVRIKNEFTKKSDTINALTYKAKEMEYHKRDILVGMGLKHIKLKNINKIYLKKIAAKLKSFPYGEAILLCLNAISNRYGLSWIRGVLFTTIIAFIFFGLINYFGIDSTGNRIFEFNLRFDFYGFDEVFVKYLKVLNVFNFNDKLPEFNLNPLGEIFFYLSKIFISYGIYQTISAFRKYGK